MKCLLDSHTLLWLVNDDPRLGPAARAALGDSSNELAFGLGNYWEICIKISLGKLRLRSGWPEAIVRNMRSYGIQWLPVERVHAEKVVGLPFHHRDPFDRLMVAQAMADGFTIVTADPLIRAYPVPVLW